MDIRNQIREFILTNFLFDDDCNLGNDDSFLENAIIDSTGVLDLLMFIEDTFEIEVQDEEVIPENFDSVNQLFTFVMSKIQALAA